MSDLKSSVIISSMGCVTAQTIANLDAPALALPGSAGLLRRSIDSTYDVAASGRSIRPAAWGSIRLGTSQREWTGAGTL
jgi:hypothetical protein